MPPFAFTVQSHGPVAGWPVGAAAAAFVAILLVIALVLRLLFRREASVVSRRTAAWLLALRLAAVAAILVALVYDPVAVTKTSEPVPGVVVVAVDRSDSMRVAEPYRPLAEKLALAERLNLFDGISSATVVKNWRSATAGGGTPKFAGPDDPERKAFDAVVAKVDALTRLAATKRILGPVGFDLIATLRAKHAVDLVSFGPDLRPLAPDLSTLSDTPLSPDATATPTDLSLPFGRATELGSTPVAVVLFTDGRHTWGDPPDARVADLAARGVPVHAVVTASASPPADVAILSAQAQAATVFKGSVVPVEAKVRVTGWPAGLVRVTMTAPDGRSVSESIGHNGTDATYPVTLRMKLDSPGPQPLVVTAKGEGTEDLLPANDARTCRVTVVKDRARVLLLDGEARWEFHYLHTCLGRDPNMDVRSIVFRQPRVGLVSETELRAGGTPALVMPADIDSLSSYDCVVLGDVEPQQLTPEWRKRIETYISDGGGTLVCVAGKRAMPREYTSFSQDPIRRLLPITDPVVSDVEAGFPLTITNAGQRAWFLALADSPAASKDQWDQFPPHYWAVVGTPKPGAEVLATAPGPEGKAMPVVVRQNYGFGRVLSLGIDSTWRWRYKAGDTFHHRFWGQVVQWAASDRLLPAVNAAGTIRFGPRESLTAGREVDIAVRSADSVTMPTGLKAATMFKLSEKPGEKDTVVATLPLTAPEGRPREWHAKARGLPPGRYAVELAVPEWAGELVGPPGPDGKPTPLRAPLDVTPPDQSELVDLTPDLEGLRKITTVTGGKIYDVDSLDDLLTSLTSKQATHETVIERPWRRSWGLLGLVVALLGTEWAVRKWVGLR